MKHGSQPKFPRRLSKSCTAETEHGPTEGVVLYSFPAKESTVPTDVLGKVSVDVLAVQESYECHRPFLKNKADTIISHPNAVVFAISVKALEVRNFLETSGAFHLLDHLLDSIQKPGIRDR